jgi:hypothetical protein
MAFFLEGLGLAFVVGIITLVIVWLVVERKRDRKP